MTLLWLAVLLPVLFRESGPDTADRLKQSGITQIAVRPPLEAAWKSQPDFAVRVADPRSAVKLAAPGVQYRANEASATRSPWVNKNGWQFLRQPHGRFYYDAPGLAAALAAAEAFMYQADAVVIARLTGDGGRLRLQLLNYAAVSRTLNGIRVRVLGRYPKHEVRALGNAGAALVDYEAAADATEFTLPELKSYAVIDLAR